MTGLMQLKKKKPLDYETTVRQALSNYITEDVFKAAEIDPKWELLWQAAVQASIAIDENDIFQAAFYMASLGHLEAELELAPLVKTAQKRERPIRDKNEKFAHLRSKVNLLAVVTWRNDTEQVYRMKEMTNFIMSVLPKFLNEGDDQLPQDRTIREWIEPYAPAYASKPGRPQKSSKSTNNN